MMRMWIAVLVVSAAFADDMVPMQVLEDTGFEGGPSESTDGGWWNQAAGQEGVISEWLEKEGRNESACVHIASEAEGSGVLIWRQHVADPPTLRTYRLSAWVKAKDVDGNVIVCIRCADETGDVVSFGTTQGTCDTLGSTDWKEITCEFVPPETTKTLEVLCFLVGKGSCWFDDVTLTAGEKAEAAAPAPSSSAPGEDQPGVFRLRGMYEVEAHDRAFEPVVLFPLPLTWGPQVPLSWEVHSNPSAMVRTWRVYERKPHDWVAEVRLPSLEKGDRFTLEWEAYVLCGPSSPAALPEVGLDRLKEVPEEARPWLASTRCVQHKHERFKAMAKELREGAKDVADLVGRVQGKLAEIYAGQEGQARDLSALEALDRPGSCTSCANVTAGVYRACGVPARVLAGYPSWSGPLQTHYIVEVWLPEAGWYVVESTMLRHPWPQSQQIAVSLVYPEDEDKSAGRACAADGVPYLSLTESPGSDGRFSMKGVIPEREWCDHEASLVRTWAKDDAAWNDTLALARRHWKAWLSKGADGPVAPDALAACRPLGQSESLEQLSERLSELLQH